MLGCQQLTELSTEYLEGSLPFWRRMQIRVHLGICKHCRNYLAQVRSTIHALQRLPRAEPSDAMRTALLERFRSSRSTE
jgi:anti-sigma factor ChrR (cupin superfamily)